jgi:uncharacterized repeat protein (TIGR03803 family)
MILPEDMFMVMKTIKRWISMNSVPLFWLALVLGSGCSTISRNESADANEPCDPYNGPILAGHVLYGTTCSHPVVYRVNTDGSGFAILHRFSPVVTSTYTNSDALWPGMLALSGNALYGMTSYGGISNFGTIFRIKTNGKDFKVLHQFKGEDGASPRAGLVSSGQVLYGTTASGGSAGEGTVFKINADGSGFSVLHSFAIAHEFNPVDWGCTNSDGRAPFSALVLSGNVLYGTTYSGGKEASGTIFRVNTDGSDFSVLHHFARGVLGKHPRWFTNTDGACPETALVLVRNTLYGMTPDGGVNGQGTLFKVGVDGTGFTVLKTFPSNGLDDSSGGSSPGPLVCMGGTLYGIPSGELCRTWGPMFRVNLDGTGFAKLLIFTNSPGMGPVTGLIPSGGVFYGTIMYGGEKGGGIVFKVNPDGTGLKVLHNFIEEWRVRPPSGIIPD